MKTTRDQSPPNSEVNYRSENNVALVSHLMHGVYSGGIKVGLHCIEPTGTRLPVCYQYVTSNMLSNLDTQ